MKDRNYSRDRRDKLALIQTLGLIAGLFTLWTAGCGGAELQQQASAEAGLISYGDYVVLGYNDLGMHCLNNDFSEIAILPPANTLRATVIRRGVEPEITQEATVTYRIVSNTKSSNKTNFWKYVKPLFGADVPPDMGLFGYGLQGQMKPTADCDFIAQGIPVVPVTDKGVKDPYQMADVRVVVGGRQVAATQPVVPVSWEMSCNRCHNTPGMTVASDILTKHDKLSGTNLMAHRPVLCSSCHADPAIGAAGQPGVKTLSSAMHSFHSTKMSPFNGDDACYSCHPGPKTQCMRDVHKANGLTCNSCHTSMEAVGDPNRRPWADLPTCGGCHHVPGHEYEQPGVLFRNSVGHNGVKCIACHGSPHAITPSTNPRDNMQPMALQGDPGPIGKKCSPCHTVQPSEPFNHTRSS